MRHNSRRLLEYLLLLAGVLGLSIWGWSVLHEQVYEDWNNWAFDRQATGQEVSFSAWLKDHWNPKPAPPPEGTPPANPTPEPANVPPKPPSDQTLMGRLRIPRLKLQAIVREGTAEKTLSIALGHIAGTAKPGQNGNVGVAGHRDSLFRGLRNIKLNDQVLFETEAGETYTYQVLSTQIVKPAQVSVLNAGLYPELTLVTCYPFNYIGSAPDRFIVKARQIGQVTHGVPVEIAKSESASPKEEEKPAAAPAPAKVIEPQPKPKEVKAALQPANPQPKPYRGGTRVVPFELATNHSRQLAPGISIGVDRTNPDTRTMDGWMWVMPDRRTIWLREQSAHKPIVVYGADGTRCEVVINSISRNTVRGFLVL